MVHLSPCPTEPMIESSNAQTAGLHGLSSMATRPLLVDLSTHVSLRLGIAVRMTSAGGVEIAKRVRSGFSADFVVLADDAVEALVSDGFAVRESVTPLFRSSVSVGIPHDAPQLDIATEDSLRSTLLAAAKVGYSTGPSGIAILRMLERWGVTDELQDRLRQATPGTPVAELLRRHEVDIGFQQLSELIKQPGVRVLGPMPPGTQIGTTFVGAVLTTSETAELAERALSEICSGAYADSVRDHGLAPVEA